MADLPIPDGFSSGAAIPEGFSQAYTGSILPFSQDEQGRMSLAVPRFLSGLANTAASAFTAPSDAYSGRLPTPYGGLGVKGKPVIPGVDDQASPQAINRAIDFGSTIIPRTPSFSDELVPGLTTAGPRIPTTQELKSAADTGYAAARASSATVPGDAVANMAQGLQQSLQNDHGIIAKTAPKTYAVLDELANPPAGGEGNYAGLEAARRGLSAIAGEGGTEGFAAKQAIPKLGEFIDSISPEAAGARANYAAAMRSNDITGALTRGNTGLVEGAEARAHATHSGGNLDNTIRQRVASYLQNEDNLRGLSDGEIAALNDVVKGGSFQNATRAAGNYLGGGGGVGGAVVGMGIGHLLGNPEVGTLGGIAMGKLLKGFENSIAARSLNPVDEMMRMRSPLYEAMRAQGLLAPDTSRSGAVMRSVLPGLLAPSGGGLLSPPIPQRQPTPLGLLSNWS